MSMTAGDVILAARAFLKDDIEPYRWRDDQFYADLDAGLLKLKARRADLLLQADRTLATVTAITATSDVLTFPDRFEDGLAAYLANVKYSSEFSDVSNLNMAAFHKQRWEEAIATL